MSGFVFYLLLSLLVLALISVRVWTSLSPAARLTMGGFAENHWPKILIVVVVLIASWLIPWGSLPQWLTVGTVGALVWPYFIILAIALAAIYGMIVGLLPEKVRPAVMPGFWAVVVLLVFSWAYWGWTSPSTTPAQAAVALPQDTPNLPRAWKADGTATDMSTWLKLKVPAHGDSQHVPGLYGGHVVWGGSGFSVRCVYANGHEGVVSEGTCGDGNIVKSYARNNGGTDLWASYAYAKAGEK